MITKRVLWIAPLFAAAIAVASSPTPAYGVKADDEAGAGGCINQWREGGRDLGPSPVPVYPFGSAVNRLIE